MKVYCEQEQLRNAIDIAISGVNKRSTIPAQKGFKLIADRHNGLTVQSVNINMGISTRFDCQVDVEGEIVVEADMFANIIRKLSRGRLLLNTTDNGKIHIENDITYFDIGFISTENFNFIEPIVNKDCEIEFEKQDFIDLISATIFSASTEENKGPLQGCLFKAKDGAVEVVALDGFRMAFAKKDINSNDNMEVIVIGSTLREILNILRRSKDEGKVRFMVGDRLVMVVTPDAIITARILEGGFADYNRFFPENINSRMVLNKIKIEEAIDRAITIGGSEKNKIVTLKKVGNNLTVLCSMNEKKSREELIIDTESGDDIETSLNARYLLDVMKAHEEEDIVFNFSSLDNNLSLCLINFLEPSEDAYKYVILPVRGNN